MASIAISKVSIAALKKELHDYYPEIKSTHLSEAIAFSLGRKTYASLIKDVKAYSNDPPIEVMNDDAFFNRLVDLGYLDDPEFSFEGVTIPEVISTIPYSAYDIEYKSPRDLAWRNLMILTINEGLRRKLFSLRPDDNRWPGAPKKDDRSYHPGYIFDFALPNGLPARGYINDAGFGELTIHAAVNPKGDELRAWNARFHAGDVFAVGWLERRKGAWLQTSDLFHCRRNLVEKLFFLSAEPLGYGDRGRVIM